MFVSLNNKLVLIESYNVYYLATYFFHLTLCSWDLSFLLLVAVLHSFWQLYNALWILYKLWNGSTIIYLEYNGKKFGFPFFFSTANTAIVNILYVSDAFPDL